MDYITCNYKKNKPKVSVNVCTKCKRRMNCLDYSNYLQPPLFPDLFKVKTLMKEMCRRDNKAKRMKPEAAELSNKPEQLALNL